MKRRKISPLAWGRHTRSSRAAAEAARRWPDILSVCFHPGLVRTRFAAGTGLGMLIKLVPFQATPEQGADEPEGVRRHRNVLRDELDRIDAATRPEHNLYLDAQQLRSVRVVIDIGMHLGLEIPRDAPFRGQGRNEVRDAKNNERHVCGRARVGERPVS